MKKFYLQKSTGFVMNQKEYDDAANDGSKSDDLVLLGEFVDKSQARRYYYQAYLKEAKGS